MKLKIAYETANDKHASQSLQLDIMHSTGPIVVAQVPFLVYFLVLQNEQIITPQLTFIEEGNLESNLNAFNGLSPEVYTWVWAAGYQVG